MVTPAREALRSLLASKRKGSAESSEASRRCGLETAAEAKASVLLLFCCSYKGRNILLRLAEVSEF